MNAKAKHWFKRYFPANLFCSLVTLVVAQTTFYFSNDRVLTAFLSSIIGTVFYYGFILTRDIIATVKLGKIQAQKYSYKSFIKNVRNLVLEFGLAEVLDTFLIAPLFMFWFPVLFNNLTIGIIVGRYLADFIFYIPTIISYELRKKYLAD